MKTNLEKGKPPTVKHEIINNKLTFWKRINKREYLQAFTVSTRTKQRIKQLMKEAQNLP